MIITPSQLLLDSSADSCIQAQSLTLNTGTAFNGVQATATFEANQIFRAPTTGIRTLFFDTRAISVDVIAVLNSQLTLRLPNSKQGYLPAFATWPLTLTLSSSGTGAVIVVLYNFRIPPIIW